MTLKLKKQLNNQLKKSHFPKTWEKVFQNKQKIMKLITRIQAGVMFIQASMPSAILTYLVSKIYSPKKISDSIASTVALSTFLSFFTLIIVVFIALKYFN